MKKATGDLASTVIVGLCVAILIAFFFYTIWPLIDNNFKSQTACEKAICETVDADGDGRVNCILCDSITSTDKDAWEHCKDKGEIIQCRFKG